MDQIRPIQRQIDEQKQLLEAFEKQYERLQAYDKYRDPPESRPARVGFERLDPCPSHWQRRMVVWLEQLGVIGLFHAISLNAIDERQEELKKNGRTGGTPSGSYDTLYADCRLGVKSRSLRYLMSMPEEVLMAVIKGNLPLMMEDRDFNAKYRDFLSLRPCQGVYIIYPHVRHTDTLPDLRQPGPTAATITGYGLSIEELLDVVREMDQYAHASNNDTLANSRAQELDSKYRNSKNAQLDHSIGERKYKQGKLKSHTLFIAALDQQYSLSKLKVWTKAEQQKRLQRCFPYVGLSHKVQERAPQHYTQVGTTSPTFGLFNAVLRALYGDKFETTGYQLIRTTDVDDIGLDEILISMLASAYAWRGGLTANHAGQQTGDQAVRDDTYNAELLESEEYYRTRPYQAANAEKSVNLFKKAQMNSEYHSSGQLRRQEMIAELDRLSSLCEEAMTLTKKHIAFLELQSVKLATQGLRDLKGSSP